MPNPPILRAPKLITSATSMGPVVETARSAETITYTRSLTLSRPAYLRGWHIRVDIRRQKLSDEARKSTPESLYKVNEVAAVLDRHNGIYAEEGDDKHTGRFESTYTDANDMSAVYELDGDVGWYYAGKGDPPSGRRSKSMRLIFDRLTTDEDRAKHERTLTCLLSKPKPHALVNYDENGQASVRKSSIRFNTVVFVHGEKDKDESSTPSTSSTLSTPNLYVPSLPHLSGGSFRHHLRDMEVDDLKHQKDASRVNVEAARRRARRKRGTLTIPKCQRAETRALERAAAWRDTLDLQATANSILDAKPDWSTERKKAFDKVLASIAKDDEEIFTPSPEDRSTFSSRFTGSLRGTIRFVKRVAPAIPLFADPVESIPLMQQDYE